MLLAGGKKRSLGWCATCINVLSPVSSPSMVDDFEGQEPRSSGELWSEICSSLPEVGEEAVVDNNTEFSDSFQPAQPLHHNGHFNGTNASSSGAQWEPMEDSEIYIASLGIGNIPASICLFEWFLTLTVYNSAQHNPNYCREPPEETQGSVQRRHLQGHVALSVPSKERVLGQIPPRCPDLWALPGWWHGWKVGWRKHLNRSALHVSRCQFPATPFLPQCPWTL